MALFAAPYPSQCTSSLTANWFGGSSLDGAMDILNLHVFQSNFRVALDCHSVDVLRLSWLWHCKLAVRYNSNLGTRELYRVAPAA